MIVFSSCHLSAEDRIKAKEKYDSTGQAIIIPIGTQMQYSCYVMIHSEINFNEMIVEFDSSLRWMEVFLEEKLAVKYRTDRGYRIIIVCAKVTNTFRNLKTNH